MPWAWFRKKHDRRVDEHGPNRGRRAADIVLSESESQETQSTKAKDRFRAQRESLITLLDDISAQNGNGGNAH